mgnify:CR=1 FL=1
MNLKDYSALIAQLKGLYNYYSPIEVIYKENYESKSIIGRFCSFAEKANFNLNKSEIDNLLLFTDPSKEANVHLEDGSGRVLTLIHLESIVSHKSISEKMLDFV